MISGAWGRQRPMEKGADGRGVQLSRASLLASHLSQAPCAVPWKSCMCILPSSPHLTCLGIGTWLVSPELVLPGEWGVMRQPSQPGAYPRPPPPLKNATQRD